ncbi:hypothetical protein QFZ58_000317 [Streptomyces sp. B1I3]|nr:hypothetical protein [Streptomyces sp. B1I3]
MRAPREAAARSGIVNDPCDPEDRAPELPWLTPSIAVAPSGPSGEVTCRRQQVTHWWQQVIYARYQKMYR